MSTEDGGPVGRREVAYRLFAAEYEGADLEFSDSEEERAPNYVVTPSGARVNRLFVVGVLTEVEPVSDDVLRARVVDPTGAFVAYAGQYQPEAVAFLEDADVPSFVSLTGKGRTFTPDGSDRVFTSVRPESITAVDAPTRDRWTVQAAEHTLARVATMARALEREERGDDLVAVLREAGVEPGLASGIAVAIDHYGTTPAYLAALREQALAATEVVTGGRESVPDLSLAPDEAGAVEADLTAAPAVVGTLAAEAELRAPSAPGEAARPPPEPAGDDPSSVPGTPEAETGADDVSTTEPVSPLEADAPPDEPAGDELGDFAGPAVSDESDPATERYEMDDEERAEVEAEFGTEFSTGSEVGDPGEAGIEPETEPPETGSDAEESGAEPAPDAEPPDAVDAGPAADEEAPAEASEDVDLEDAAVETMAELDDGDGVARDELIEAITATHDVDASAVEDAIQDALMGGRCYEPTDGTLKAI